MSNVVEKLTTIISHLNQINGLIYDDEVVSATEDCLDNNIQGLKNDVDYWIEALRNCVSKLNSSESSDNEFNDEIAEALRLAGIQLNEDWFTEHQSKNANTVKDLIEKLQQCDPNATVIVSEKPGRGGASCYVYQGYTDKNGFYLNDEQNEEYSIPAIEITCDF